MSAHYSRIAGNIYRNDETGEDFVGTLDVLLPEVERLRADNERLNKVYQLAVAECVKACDERDMHKRNWTNTMAHRDRLQTQTEQLEASLSAAQKRVEEARVKVSALLNKMNAAYANGAYKAAWVLYDSHFGNYKLNGGVQWQDEENDLAAWLAEEEK
jgi:chromosome segregation ATPase